MQHARGRSLYSIPQCFIQSNLNVLSSDAPITFPGTIFCRLTRLTICIFPHEIKEIFSLPFNPLVSLNTLLCTLLSFQCLLPLTPAPLLLLCVSQTRYGTQRVQNAEAKAGWVTYVSVTYKWLGHKSEIQGHKLLKQLLASCIPLFTSLFLATFLIHKVFQKGIEDSFHAIYHFV